jgi:hypothetical protein
LLPDGKVLFVSYRYSEGNNISTAWLFDGKTYRSTAYQPNVCCDNGGLINRGDSILALDARGNVIIMGSYNVMELFLVGP